MATPDGPPPAPRRTRIGGLASTLLTLTERIDSAHAHGTGETATLAPAIQPVSSLLVARSCEDRRVALIIPSNEPPAAPAAPTYAAAAFVCPQCEVLAQQVWLEWTIGYQNSKSQGLVRAQCVHCKRISVWLNLVDPPVMVWPLVRLGPQPHAEMQDDPRKLYEEARSIAQNSPRAAVALLRVAVDVLLRQLFPDAKTGDTLDTLVGRAVALGLAPQVQRSLDALRVIGNDAVHPQQLVLDDANATKTFEALCLALNIVVEQMLSVPRQSAELFASLPESKRQQIEKRDGVGGTPQG